MRYQLRHRVSRAILPLCLLFNDLFSTANVPAVQKWPHPPVGRQSWQQTLIRFQSIERRSSFVCLTAGEGWPSEQRSDRNGGLLFRTPQIRSCYNSGTPECDKAITL